jgi:hypothetical protein
MCSSILCFQFLEEAGAEIEVIILNMVTLQIAQIPMTWEDALL